MTVLARRGEVRIDDADPSRPVAIGCMCWSYDDAVQLWDDLSAILGMAEDMADGRDERCTTGRWPGS